MNTIDYHSDYSSISKTMLSHFADSPSLFDAYYVSKKMVPPTPATCKIGSIVHDVVLSNVPMDQIAIEYPDECLNKNDGLIGKKAEAFRCELQPNQYAVKRYELDLCQSIIERVKRYLKSRFGDVRMICEQPIYWEQTVGDIKRINCRCKPDILIEYPDRIVVPDLKISEQPTPPDFKRVANKFRYWLQDAHYSSGIFAKYGKKVEFEFIVVEQSHNARIGSYRYNEQSRDRAAAEHELLLEELSDRISDDNWTDNWTQEENLLDLSPWDTPLKNAKDNSLDNQEVIWNG